MSSRSPVLMLGLWLRLNICVSSWSKPSSCPFSSCISVTALIRRVIAASLGKVTTTRMQLLISSSTGSRWLVLQTFLPYWSDKLRKASTSSLVSIIFPSALVKRSAKELARSSQRVSISAAFSLSNT